MWCLYKTRVRVRVCARAIEMYACVKDDRVKTSGFFLSKRVYVADNGPLLELLIDAGAELHPTPEQENTCLADKGPLTCATVAPTCCPLAETHLNVVLLMRPCVYHPHFDARCSEWHTDTHTQRQTDRQTQKQRQRHGAWPCHTACHS